MTELGCMRLLLEQDHSLPIKKNLLRIKRIHRVKTDQTKSMIIIIIIFGQYYDDCIETYLSSFQSLITFDRIETLKE
jgi:hypothetical protein